VAREQQRPDREEAHCRQRLSIPGDAPS
jgi:hypothetical protein